VNRLRLARNVRKTDQARQQLQALGEAMKETDARTRAEMCRFRSAQRTPAYSLPAHANPRACSLPAHGHAVCQSCTRVSKGVGFQSLRAHAFEPTNAWVGAISAQREDTPHHKKGVRVMDLKNIIHLIPAMKLQYYSNIQLNIRRRKNIARDFLI
jgi:hypothetical protein